MKTSLMVTTSVAACVAVIGMVGVTAGQTAHAAPVPAMAAHHVDDFQLTDNNLMAQSLYYYKYAPAIVIMSQTDGSKVSQESAAQLDKIAASYKDKGVIFFMLNSNLKDSRDAIQAEAKKHGFATPILIDEQQLVGENLGVQKEGEVFVIDTKGWNVAYHGPLDGGLATKALDSVLGNQPVQTARVDVKAGQTIAFPERAKSADFTKISYNNEVAPILQDKCVSCHLKGGIAPFAMDSYEVIKGFAPMIRETVRTDRMPPYFADPHIGEFQHDQGMTSDQKKTLVHWIEAGAPRGAGEDPLLANKGKVAPEWPVALGKPDVIIDLPAFSVPANGIIEYQNQRVKNPFTQDAWLRAVSIKPGDRGVVHHVVSNWVGDSSKADIPGGSVGSYTPGAEAQVMGEGAGAPIPAGGMLNFQLHYTTNGKPSVDHTQVGFYVMKTPPKYIKRSTVISDGGLYIPAGEARHKEIAYQTFPADAYIYTLYPHSHYRGMHVELWQKTLDGKTTPLIVLPKYDFNWQRDYDPTKPILVKAGTKLIATWVYDNSSHNKANPDPKRNVTWGEQTPDEMMYFRVNYRFVDETVDHVRNDLQQKLQASSMMGALDDNADDLIQPDELTGRYAPIKAKFAEFDKHHRGGLDETEFKAAMAATPGLNSMGRGGGRGRPAAQEIPDL
jgi:hypothetical protein